MIDRMKNKRIKTQATPWTMAASITSTIRKPGQSFDPRIYRKLLTSLLINSNSSFRLVEGSSSNQLMKYCNTNIPQLSLQTAARYLQKMHPELKPKIKNRFGKHRAIGGKVNITLDAWTSGRKFQYLGITVYWMDSNYDLSDTVIGFKRLQESHTAENLYNILGQCLEEFGLENHIRCITADNYKVNISMFNLFEKAVVYWNKQDGQVRCMAHVMNLSAPKIIQSLKAETLVTETEASMAEQITPTQENCPAGLLRMVRRIASKIRASNNLTEALSAPIAATKLKDVKVLLDMKIRYVHLPVRIFCMEFC